MIDDPARRQFSRFDNLSPRAFLRSRVIFGRKKPNAGRIRTHNIVAFRRVLLEGLGLIMQCLFPAAAIPVRLGSVAHETNRQTDNENSLNHIALPDGFFGEYQSTDRSILEILNVY